MLCIMHKCRVYIIGLKITASQQTMSGQDDHLSQQTYGLQFILMGHIITITFRGTAYFLIMKYVFSC